MKRIFTLAIILSTCAANAQNVLTNGNFSADSYPTSAYSNLTALTGWYLIGGDISGIGVGYLGAATQEIDVSGAHDKGGTGISQTFATTVGQTYNVSFDVYTGGTQYTGGVDYYLNGGLVASNLQGFAVTGTAGRETYTDSFIASSATSEIKFMDNHGNVSHVGQVDVQPVPEPASIAALGMGLIGISRRRRSVK